MQLEQPKDRPSNCPKKETLGSTATPHCAFESAYEDTRKGREKKKRAKEGVRVGHRSDIYTISSTAYTA